MLAGNVGGDSRPGLLPLEARALLSTLTVTNDTDSGTGLAPLRAGPRPERRHHRLLAQGLWHHHADQRPARGRAPAVNIQGPGADKVTVSGDDSSKVFDVESGVTASISGLTITDGVVARTFTAAGGILNQGTLTLSDAVVTGNSAPSGSSPAAAVDNFGTMTIADCTISGNSGPYGGGVNNDGPLPITDSTISGNSAPDSRAAARGHRRALTSLTITGSTISGNSGSDRAPSTLSADWTSSAASSAATRGRLSSAFRSFEAGAISARDNDDHRQPDREQYEPRRGPTGSSRYGGGIDANGDLTITGSTISGNTAEGLFASGGGIDMIGLGPRPT